MGIGDDRRDDHRARAARAVVFVVVSVYVVANPLLKQGFNVRWQYLRGWEMFSGIGVGLVDATFTSRDAEGHETPLPPLATGPAALIHGEAEFDRVVRSQCAKLGSKADVRANARIARKNGWHSIEHGRHNLCERAPPKPAVAPPPVERSTDGDPD